MKGKFSLSRATLCWLVIFAAVWGGILCLADAVRPGTFLSDSGVRRIPVCDLSGAAVRCVCCGRLEGGSGIFPLADACTCGPFVQHLAAEYATSYKACTAGALLCVVRHRCFLSGSCGRNDCPSGPRLCPEQVHPITIFLLIPGTCGAGDFCFFQPFLNRIQIFLQNKLQPIFCVPGLLLAQLRA